MPKNLVKTKKSLILSNKNKILKICCKNNAFLFDFFFILWYTILCNALIFRREYELLER